MGSLKWPAAYSLAQSDDGGLMACVGPNVVVIDMDARVRASRSRPLSHPANAAFSPDGRRLAVKSTGGTIKVVEPWTGQDLAGLTYQNEGEGCGLSFSPDGEALIDGSWSGALSIRNAVNGVVMARQH